MKSIKRLMVTVVVVLAGLWAAGFLFKWTAERVYVAPGKALMVINKFGKSLPSDRIVVPANDNQYKGVQEELRGPGRYFLNPLFYDWQLVDQVEVSAGNPEKWEWNEFYSHINDPRTLPQVALVALKEGKAPPPGATVVDEGYKGIQRRVLTPGVYKINPQRYEVKLVDAVVVAPGSVGVVTRLVGDVGEVLSTPLTAVRSASVGATSGAATVPAQPQERYSLVTGPNQRGILKDVLQPGIYYLNPKLVSVNVVTVGYDAIALDHSMGTGITFYTSDGYQVEADFTVVWGRTPADAPNIIANIGGVDTVEKNVIEPAMKAACQNEGGRYSAKELIQGSTRSAFQDALSQALEKHVQSRHLHVLLALIRTITVHDTNGNDATMSLLGTIQQANIEVERDLTNQQKTQTAVVKATLEQAQKLVDVARETVTSETGVKVANINADAQKKAAEIDAQRELDVAAVQLQVAQLEAQRTEILGKASAEVDRLRNEAQAKGSKLMVDAFGSPQAYNLYIFAKNFAPDDLRLIFAGPGTFWTDLKGFEQVGAAKIIQNQPVPEALKK